MLWFGALFAAGVANSTQCLAQSPQYVKVSDLPITNRSFPGDYATAGLTESPARPGTFFGQLPLDENNSLVYWVNTKGVFGTGPAVDGNCPQGNLISAGDGTFWGTSGGMGGSGIIWYGAPTVPLYRVDAHGAYATVYNFTFDQGETFNQLTFARGCLYGTAVLGGVANKNNDGGDGTVIKVNPDLSVTTIRQLDRTTHSGDAALPTGPLLLAADGNLYGTSIQGGTKNGGAIFKLNSKDQFSIVHSFIGSDGQAPFGCLVQGRSGMLYGTTNSGGKFGKGTVFCMTPTGKVTTLYSFGAAALPHDGLNPVAGLVMGHDGNLYGTTWLGGAYSVGTVFRITPEGKITYLHSFGSASDDGASPCGVLTVGMDGNLYGSTSWGGVDNAGTIFKVVIESPPVLSLSLEASGASVAAGSNIVYTIGCTNHGSVTAYDMQLEANLPAHTKLVTQGPGGNTWTQAGTQLSCDVGSIRPGQTLTGTLIVSVDPSTASGTRIVNLIDGVFNTGTIRHSSTSSVTALMHQGPGFVYTSRNSDPTILLGAGAGVSPRSPALEKLQLTSKLGALWLNFDVSNNKSGAFWRSPTDSTQGMAQLQVLPPNSNQADILGIFSGPNDSLTVTANPTTGGFGYAGFLNELQLMGLLPKVGIDSALPFIAQVVPRFTGLKDFANASGAFNQALTDYTNSNWGGINADLQNMSASLMALANNQAESAQFVVYVEYLNPGIQDSSIRGLLQQAAKLSNLASLFTDRPDVMSDILMYDLSAAQHGGGVSTTFYAIR